MGWLPVLLMGMFPWLHIFGGDGRMGEDICEGLETVCEARRRTGDFGIAVRGQKWFIFSCKIKNATNQRQISK